MNELQAASFLCEIIQRVGHQAVLAGGCVRDMLLNRPFNDIDIATDCPEDKLISILKSNSIKTKNVGKAFGVTLAQIGEYTFEIARFRKDINCDGRHPEEVQFCKMEEDAQRRDFTINAVFYDPVANRHYDFVGGIEDINNHRLRFVGDPQERIKEDYLRILRYVRFYAQGFKTIKAIRNTVDSYAEEMLRVVSPERIRIELMDKLLPALNNTKVFKEFPKLFDFIFDSYPGQLLLTKQSIKWHPEGDVWTHTLKVVNCLLGNRLKTPLLIVAAILHDFGKIKTTTFDPKDNDWHSFGHEKVSADMAEDWMKRFKFSNEDIAYVHWLVLNHMKLHYPGLKKSTLKRLMHEGDIQGLMIMTLSDCMGACGDITQYLAYEEKIKAILSEGTDIRPAPLLTGFDLIKAGMKPGRHFGVILSKAYDRQLEDVTVTKELLLKEALQQDEARTQSFIQG